MYAAELLQSILDDAYLKGATAAATKDPAKPVSATLIQLRCVPFALVSPCYAVALRTSSHVCLVC